MDRECKLHKFFPPMVEYKSLRENSTRIIERERQTGRQAGKQAARQTEIDRQTDRQTQTDKRERQTYRVYRNMKGCILEANREEQEW